MKGVFVVLDGIGDEPCSALSEKTPLEYAKTPNLDKLARESKVDRCYTVKEGYVPESNEGVLSLLGYDYNAVKRGVLEALGLGVNFRNGDLVFRCNFATIDDVEKGNVIDRRAGRTLTTKEARILADAVNKEVKLPYKFEFQPSVQHRGVLVIHGDFSDDITGVETKGNKLVFSSPLSEKGASHSSELINLFVRKSFDVLHNHPVNLARIRKGLYPANIILCRGAGNEKPKLKKLKGKWMGLGYMPLEKGIARIAGMDVYSFEYPKLKKIDVYDNLYKGLKKAMKNAIRMLKRNKGKYDYFYVHFKETDIPGHDNKPKDKVRMIEMLDKRFFSFLRKFAGDAKIVITGDHATVCKKKAHGADAVPVLSYPYESRIKSERFTEEEGKKGKLILGKKLLAERMFD